MGAQTVKDVINALVDEDRSTAKCRVEVNNGFDIEIDGIYTDAYGTVCLKIFVNKDEIEDE